MKIRMSPIIQIAGIHDLNEAELIVKAGANYLGFPLRLPDGREDLSEEDARSIIKSIGDRAKSVLITYLDNAAEIIEFCKFLNVSGLQLHGPIASEELAKLQIALPELFIIKSLVVRRDNSSELKSSVENLNNYVNAYITDTYDPKTGKSGATGKTHDWSISRGLVHLSPNPVILAGGLSPDNVYDAILQVQPAGVDSHSLVEGINGRKDSDLVRIFVNEAQKAFKSLA